MTRSSRPSPLLRAALAAGAAILIATPLAASAQVVGFSSNYASPYDSRHSPTSHGDGSRHGYAPAPLFERVPYLQPGYAWIPGQWVRDGRSWAWRPGQATYVGRPSQASSFTPAYGYGSPAYPANYPPAYSSHVQSYSNNNAALAVGALALGLAIHESQRDSRRDAWSHRDGRRHGEYDRHDRHDRRHQR